MRAFEERRTNIVYVYETDPPAAALSAMAVSGYRHVPGVDFPTENATIP